MKNILKVDDLGVPPFVETPIYLNGALVYNISYCLV